MLQPDEIDRMRQAAAADPTLSVRLCDMLVAAGRADEAVSFCRQELRNRPDDVDLRLALGRALSAAGNLEEAQAALFDAVARKRRNTVRNLPVGPFGAAVPEPGAPTPVPLSGTSRHAVPPPIPSMGTSRHALSGVPAAIPSTGTSRHTLPTIRACSKIRHCHVFPQSL